MKIGIAGDNGSGKSTLLNLLMRFYDPIGRRDGNRRTSTCATCAWTICAA